MFPWRLGLIDKTGKVLHMQKHKRYDSFQQVLYYIGISIRNMNWRGRGQKICFRAKWNQQWSRHRWQHFMGMLFWSLHLIQAKFFGKYCGMPHLQLCSGMQENVFIFIQTLTVTISDTFVDIKICESSWTRTQKSSHHPTRDGMALLSFSNTR